MLGELLKRFSTCHGIRRRSHRALLCFCLCFRWKEIKAEVGVAGFIYLYGSGVPHDMAQGLRAIPFPFAGPGLAKSFSITVGESSGRWMGWDVSGCVLID